MADYTNRKREPCTTYKREGRTKENIFECLPSGAVEYTPVCGKNRCGPQDIYECCPPTPVELRCSVCWTAERDSCNIWTCVPYVSYSVLCGPTLADLLVYLLNLFPLSFLACIGIAHPRCCTAKPKPPPCIPERPPPECPPARCAPVNRCAPCAPVNRCAPCAPVNRCAPCAPVNRCAPAKCTPVNICSEKREAKNCGPCTTKKSQAIYEGGDAVGCSNDNRVFAWMHDEYESLARELADIKRLTKDDEQGNSDSDRDLLQARNYVLDRLAEMLAKREEIERRMEKKKQTR